MKKTNIGNWNTALHVYSLQLLLFPFCLTLFVSAAFLVGSAPHAVYFWLALLLSASLSYYFSKAQTKSFVIAECAALFTLATSMIISFIFLDFQWDAMAFHNPAAFLMLEGWNPVRDSLSPLVIDQIEQIRIYPKAEWYIAAICAQTFGFISIGKFSHLVMILVAAVVTRNWLRRGLELPSTLCTIFAGAIAANPVAIMQWQTAYNDGATASLLTIMLVSLCAFVKSGDRKELFFIIISAVFCSCLKFNSLVYVVVFWSVFFAWIIWKRRDLSPSYSLATAIGLLLFFLVGANSYITNTLDYGSPLYPYVTISKDKGFQLSEDISTAVGLPEGFQNADRFTRFIKGSFLLPGWTPRSIGKLFENFWVEALQYPPNLQVNLGGWGPFFWLFLLACVPMLFFVKQPEVRGAIIALLISMFVHAQGWFVRYTPQSWLLPALIFATASRTRFMALASSALGVVMILNAAIVFYYGSYYYDIRTLGRYYERVAILKEEHAKATPDVVDRFLTPLVQLYPDENRFNSMALQNPNYIRVRENMVLSEASRLREFGVPTPDHGEAPPDLLEKIQNVGPKIPEYSSIMRAWQR